jgi:cytochrome P450
MGGDGGPRRMIRIVSAAAMALPAWPVLRALLTPALWRAFPHAAVRLLAALGAGLATLVLILALAPAPLAVAAAAAALAIAAGEAWLAWPARGTRRGLPPGSLGLLPPGPWRRQSFFADEAGRHGPVFKSRQMARPMACLSSLPEARRLLREQDASLDVPPLPFSRFIPGGYLRYRGRSEHRHYRDVFRAAFSQDVVAAREDAIRAGIRAGLTAMAAEGPGGAPPRARVNRMLFPVWAGVFAGFEPDAPATARLRDLSLVIDRRNLRFASDRRVREAVRALTAMLEEQRRSLERLPEGSVPPSFLDEIRRRRPDALDDPAVLGNLVFLFHVTWSDVAGLLTWITRLLADHPSVLAAARAEVARGDAAGPGRDALCTRVVLETLRLEQSEFLYRRTTCPLTVGPHTVPAGWLLRVNVHEAHRSPDVFGRPDAFDPERFLGRSFTKDEYSPFGAYRLACLGEQVTIAVGRVFTEELSRFDLRTVRDAPAELGSWGHWAPGRRWRLALHPAGPRGEA